ncbi:MAG TPA: enoyl-CoA hydratase/isomerase family protein [Xanthobacteraceae bacterium]|nr:enoyl-CoA hydratase/isomerase family protein [Xanthobacteraceae bacterium]
MQKLATSHEHPDAREPLLQAGLPKDIVTSWLAARPEASADFKRDIETFSHFWKTGANLLAMPPRKPARKAEEQRAAALILEISRAARDRFLVAHVEELYRALTKNYANFIRAERLVYDAAALVPGLTPTAAEVEDEMQFPQKDKDGVEIDQGIFLSRVLEHPRAGTHLCHAMLLPRAESLARLSQFLARGSVEMKTAAVERRGKASFVTLRHPRSLNAEDELTIDEMETAIDLANLDPETSIAIFRGDVVENPKYKGRRVFCSGINLTHLYHGKIGYLWYIRRDMGPVNKIFRGVAKPELTPDDISGPNIEKPWIAAVDTFAIGGGCQYLLTMDYVLAAKDAYMTLPARKEGIIPGASNLRLPRFVGDRIARQAIMYGRRLDCDSPEGRMICDEVVPPAEMDAALDRVIDGLTSSGVVSAASNRRAFRVGQEPLDLFRRYIAVYAREQAYCHFSPALIANLERHWNAQNRKF